MLPGVFKASKKDGTIYYRSSITINNKHISLGSYSTEEEAFNAYLTATKIMSDNTITIDSDLSILPLQFSKIISLINLRDNKIYMKTPIYLRQNYFQYFISPEFDLKFDNDDLFYYSTRTITVRKGHFFVADYGMQLTIKQRYGIKEYAVRGRDYDFANGDESDYRRTNIIILNSYNGVEKTIHKKKTYYKAFIHINGDFILGHFENETRAAIAYNKAVDEVHRYGINKHYNINFVDGITNREYATIYSTIRLPSKFIDYLQAHKVEKNTK